MSHLDTLRARRDLTKARMEHLHAAASGRAMSDGERATWRALESELTALDNTLRRLDADGMAAQSQDVGQHAAMVARRAELVATLEGIETLAAEQDRAMTPDELAKWDLASRELGRLSPAIDRMEHEASMAAHGALAGDSAGTWSRPEYP